MKVTPLFLLAALLLGASCGDKALEKRYESLQQERKVIQQDMVQVSNQADRIFFEATSAERQAGRAITGAARCTAPRGTHRPAGPMTFGPVKLRYQEHSFTFHESSPFETAALQCVQGSVAGR